MPRNKEFDYDEKLIAARNLFWEKGYNATSINDLEDILKINRSSIYQTYGSKHDLFLKSLINYLKLKELEYKEAGEIYGEPLEAVANIVRSVVKNIIKDEKTCLAVNSAFELARIDEAVRKILSDQTLKAVGMFQDLLINAKKLGQLNNDTDTKVLAHYLLAGLTSIWHNHILFRNEKLTEQMTGLLLETIKK